MRKNSCALLIITGGGHKGKIFKYAKFLNFVPKKYVKKNKNAYYIKSKLKNVKNALHVKKKTMIILSF